MTEAFMVLYVQNSRAKFDVYYKFLSKPFKFYTSQPGYDSSVQKFNLSIHK